MSSSRANVAVAQRLCSIAALLLLLSGLAACSDDGILIDVTVLHRPPEVRSLQVRLLLDGKPDLRSPQHVTQHLDGFVVRLTPEKGATLALELDGVDAAGCQIATGNTEIMLSGQRRYSVEVLVYPSEARGCSVLVAKAGDGSGVVRSQPTGIDCGANCSLSMTLGSAVELDANPSSMTSYFAGWSGACQGEGVCSLLIGTRAANVVAGFLKKRCSTGGFCWENPLPEGNTVNAIWGTSDTNIWAVNENGKILKWNGTYWRVDWEPANEARWARLKAIWGTGATDVWVVGAPGILLHWDGRAWRNVLPEGVPPVGFTSIWGSSPSNIWVVGDRGIALKYDGELWSPFNTDPTNNLVSVWTSSPENAWAVGTKPSVVHWDGRKWQDVSTAGLLKENTGLLSVRGSGPDDVWIASDYGDLLHWKGRGLERVESGTASPLRSLWVQGPAEAWVLDDSGTILKWNGSAWVPIGGVHNALNFWKSDTDTFWIAGVGGSIFRGKGGAFTPSNNRITQSTIAALWGSSASNIWAVGEQGTILHWNGAEWSAAPSGTGQSLLAIWGSGPNSIWVITNGGTLLYWKGTVWSQTPIREEYKGMEAIWGTGPDDFWLVGREQKFIHWDGISYKSVDSTPLGKFHGVFGADSRNVWAVGHFALVARWNGATWMTEKVGSERQWFWSVWASSSTDVWAAGFDLVPGPPGTAIPKGNIWHWNGAGWALSYEQPGYCAFTKIWGLSAADIWAAGNCGNFVHWDGAAWTPVESGAVGSISSLWGPNSSELWAAGQSGTLLRFRRKETP